MNWNELQCPTTHPQSFMEKTLMPDSRVGSRPILPTDSVPSTPSTAQPEMTQRKAAPRLFARQGLMRLGNETGAAREPVQQKTPATAKRPISAAAEAAESHLAQINQQMLALVRSQNQGEAPAADVLQAKVAMLNSLQKVAGVPEEFVQKQTSAWQKEFSRALEEQSGSQAEVKTPSPRESEPSLSLSLSPQALEPLQDDPASILPLTTAALATVHTPNSLTDFKDLDKQLRLIVKSRIALSLQIHKGTQTASPDTSDARRQLILKHEEVVKQMTAAVTPLLSDIPGLKKHWDAYHGLLVQRRNVADEIGKLAHRASDAEVVELVRAKKKGLPRIDRLIDETFTLMAAKLPTSATGLEQKAPALPNSPLTAPEYPPPLPPVPTDSKPAGMLSDNAILDIHKNADQRFVAFETTLADIEKQAATLEPGDGFSASAADLGAQVQRATTELLSFIHGVVAQLPDPNTASWTALTASRDLDAMAAKVTAGQFVALKRLQPPSEAPSVSPAVSRSSERVAQTKVEKIVEKANSDISSYWQSKDVWTREMSVDKKKARNEIEMLTKTMLSSLRSTIRELRALPLDLNEVLDTGGEAKKLEKHMREIGRQGSGSLAKGLFRGRFPRI